MIAQHIYFARRYARAFVHVFGSDVDMDECVLIKSAAEYLHTHRAILHFFLFVQITEAERMRMINTMLKYLHLQPVFGRLLALLIEHKRISLLPEILDSIVYYFYDTHALVPLCVTSCPTLDSHEQEIMRIFLRRLVGSNVSCSFFTNASLIAGVRVQGLGLLWERSIIGRLNAARRDLYAHGQYCVGGL